MRVAASCIAVGACLLGHSLLAEDFAPPFIGFPPPGSWEFHVDLSKHSKAAEISHVSAGLANREGKQLCLSQSVNRGEGHAEVHELPAGFARRLRAHHSGIDHAGQVVYYQASSAFTRPPAPAWLNNLGNEDTVPPPWSPVKVVDNTVVTWNRKYVFGPLGLPASMVSAGEDLLGQPMRTWPSSTVAP